MCFMGFEKEKEASKERNVVRKRAQANVAIC
jgi:hypothetical protein